MIASVVASGIASVEISLATISQGATGELITAVWQGVLLSGLVALGLRLLPKTPAAVRFAIWLGVFAAVAVLPLTGLFHRGAVLAGHAPWLTLDARWCVAVGCVWAIASLVRASTLVLAVFRVRALWMRATLIEGMRGARAGVSGPLAGDGRRAQLCLSDEVDRPTVIGFFSPKILIPAWLVEKLTTSELEQIVLHESGHLSRADDWMNLLQKIALVVFPLNPALAWVERRLCFERELACDERVLQATGAPKAYAECLASLAEHRLGRSGRLVLALGALGRESELGRRVRRILGRGELMRPGHAKLLLGGAMLGLLTAAAGLERCPQVVGFASDAPMNIAASAPFVVGTPTAGARSMYRDVVYRVPSRSTFDSRHDSRVPTNVDRATNLVARVHAARRAAFAYRTSAIAWKAIPRLGQTRATNVSQTNVSQMIPTQQRAGAAGALVQWVVITTWQREDGATMVLTSAHISEGLEPVVRTQSFGESSPYAAVVPVRGGWLIFEL